MDKKAPLSDNSFEDLLKKHFLGENHYSPQNEKIMEILSQHVMESPVFMQAATKKITFKTFLKKYAWLFIAAPVALAVYVMLSKSSVQTIHHPEQEVVAQTATEKNNTSSLPPSGNNMPAMPPAETEKKAEQYSLTTDSTVSTTREFTIETAKNPGPQTVRPHSELTLAVQDDFRLPVLTPEEKKANHKQKKKMMEKLLKRDKSTWLYIPSGTFVYKKDTVSLQAFYMRKTEITNLEFRTFLFDLLIEGKTDLFMKVRPVQNLWTNRFNASAYNKPMEEHYFSHPAYNDYPVVNISHEAALQFCIWLTAESNKKALEEGKNTVNDLRLPYEQEWAYAALEGKNNAMNSSGNDSLKNKKGDYMVNYSCLNYEYARYDSTLKYWIPADGKGFNLMRDGGYHTVKADRYAPNKFGLHCMSGNVSEMVLRYNYKTKAKSHGTIGGSWLSPDFFLNVEAPEEWPFEKEGPSPMIGFRPVFTFLQ